MTSMTIRALVVTPAGGEIRSIAPTLKIMQSLVDGWIEGVGLEHGHLYCNEEGKRLGLPPNNPATALARALGWQGDVLLGDVVFLGDDDSGDEGDVPDAVVEAWHRLAGQ